MKEFYKYTLGEVFDILISTEHGLTQSEAKSRLEKYGLNKLPEGKTDSLFVIFFRQFKSPLIYILLAACLTVFIMGEILDGWVILAVLVFNAIIGMIQEGKAQNTLLALKKFTETKATVLREGKELIIPDDEVVVGDIIILQEGEKVPADARIISAINLTADEASLTGESEPVLKSPDVLKIDKLLIGDQKNMVFKGTNILIGNGRAVVVATGIETIIGKISQEIAIVDTEIPLKANIRHLSSLIIFVVGILSAVLFIIGIFSGESVGEMFSTVISLAVSIIPEGLPVATTLVLATGVWRMSKRNALIKKLQAVESLGQASVIAVDKTGTITKNEMIVQQVYVPGDKITDDDKIFEIKGSGYEPTGEVLLSGNIVDPVNHPELVLIGKLGIFCANARVLFSEKENIWRVAGDPTEAAMLVMGQKFGFHKDDLLRESPFVEEIPFDYRLKYHATVHLIDNKKILSVAGAPEEVLNLSTKIWRDGKSQHLSDKERTKIDTTFIKMSGQGLRVIALAMETNFVNSFTNESIKELIFVGLLAMKDALRPEVPMAMQQAIAAGIRVVMITGDHKITAQAIASEAGIYKEGDLILTGQEIDNISDDDLTKKLPSISVFTRVTPEHKLRIIKLYKARGEIIAMTGDGVNDAPSLVAADLGVAMGKIGTEVAKEASDIILLDDNFGSIVSAVEEGRGIYKTIKKVILYLFSTSIGEAFTIIGALLLGMPLPLLPAQIIWLNFVTDGFLVVALGMEPKEDGLLKNNFKKPKKYLVDKIMGQRIFIMAIPMVIGAIFIFGKYFEGDMVKAWTMSLTILAVFQWFNAWNCRHESRSVFGMNPFSNIFLIGALIIVITLHLILIYNPFMQGLFKTTALSLGEWLMIIAISSSIVWIEEFRKLIQRKFHN